jgi:hypothetical protein
LTLAHENNSEIFKKLILNKKNQGYEKYNFNCVIKQDIYIYIYINNLDLKVKNSTNQPNA